MASNEAVEKALKTACMGGFEASADRMREILAAAATIDGDYNAGIEAAAKVAEGMAAKFYDHAKGPYLHCADKIRKLKRL